MAVLSNTGIRAGASGAGGAAETGIVANSLRFNSDDSASLSRTFADANTQTYTLSCWIKRSEIGTGQRIYTTNSDSYIAFDSDKLHGNLRGTSGSNSFWYTDALFRDVGSWSHYVFVYDLSNGTQADRFKIYVNGVEQTFTSTSFPTNDQHSGGTHTIGGPWYYGDFYLADTHYIGGQALDATSFGEEDATTGQWVPIEYTGSYGTNGFHLKFDNTSDLGEDSSGNDNDWTANNLVGSVTSLPCVEFDGSGDYLEIANSTDLDQEGDFTQECFYYQNGPGQGSVDIIYLKNVTNYGYIGIDFGGTNQIKFQQHNIGNLITGPVMASRQWYHLAATRSGSTVRLFVDGVLVGTTTYSTDTTGTALSRIGGVAGAHSLNGFISNLRVIKGTALYTSDFTVPTAPLTNVTNTKLLCCQSDTSAGAAAVSPSISGVNNGTVWSDDVSGTAYGAGYGAEILFDGSDDYAQSAYPGSLTWTPSGGMAFSSTLELEVYRDGSNALTIVHAGGSTDVSSQITNSQWFKWTVTGITSPITSITWASTGSGNYIAARAVYIDSVELRDPVTAYGDAAATTKSDGASLDLLADSPSTYNDGGNGVGNYCTWNPLAVQPSGHGGLRQGNLEIIADTAGSHKGTLATFALPSTGKWYWEVKAYRTGAINNGGGAVGVAEASAIVPTAASGTRLGNTNSSSWTLGLNDFDARHAGTVDYSDYLNGGSAVTDTGIIGIAVDMDNDKMWMHYNGTYGNAGGTGNPATGANPMFSGEFSGLTLFPAAGISVDSGSGYITANFGQRPFEETVPTGFKALNTYNLDDPLIDDPSLYFDTKLYTGDGNSSNAQTGLNFSPDFAWVKPRSAAYSHNLYDTIRGDDKRLVSNADSAEQTVGFEFQSNGFDPTGSNDNSTTYVTWAWDAGSEDAETNDAGSIDSEVKANTSAGFSIVSYDSDSSAVTTVGHGLSAVPNLIFWKDRDAGTNWFVYHNAGTAYMFEGLNTTSGGSTTINNLNSTLPTTSVFTLNSGGYSINPAGNHAMIAYCFSEVEGYSKISQYTSSGGTDNFIYTGFRPTFLIAKRVVSSADSTYEGWIMFDSKRGAYNINDESLYANESQDEGKRGQGSAAGSTFGVDFLSNGFSFYDNATEYNRADEEQYIYYAVAESPFKYSNAR